MERRSNGVASTHDHSNGGCAHAGVMRAHEGELSVRDEDGARHIRVLLPVGAVSDVHHPCRVVVADAKAHLMGPVGEILLLRVRLEPQPGSSLAQTNLSMAFLRAENNWVPVILKGMRAIELPSQAGPDRQDP